MDSDQTTARDRATQLFLQHYQFVAQVAFSAAPSKSLQDDIVHDTFIQFVKDPDKWDLDRDVRPLLRSIAENMALKYWRDRMRTMPPFVVELMESVRMDMSAVVEKEVTVEDRMSVLNLCMKKLTERNRKILQLYYFEHTPLTKVATQLGINLSTLRKGICRVREVLRECIEKTLAASEDDHD